MQDHKLLFLAWVLCVLVCDVAEGKMRAGVSKVDGTLPVGTPLAGYNYPPRRTEIWPIPEPKQYTTWMSPSVGVLEPTWVKALILDDGETQVCIVTLDAIGANSELNFLAYSIAYQMGFRIPMDNIVFSSAHTHSGPGAIGNDFLWAIAPATDLLVPELQRQLATSMATAMTNAYNNMTEAVIAIGSGNLTGVTHNRRAGLSPYVTSGSIDPNLGIIRVDTVGGQPIATLWNYAIHGICYDAPNMMFSGDIMGMSCQHIEETIGGVALFANADAGDINPDFSKGVCDNAPDFAGSYTIAKAVVAVRSTLNTTDTLTITAKSQVVDFGPTDLNATLERFGNCSHGGPLDICTLCAVLHCDYNAHLNSAWIDNQPRFTAINFNLQGRNAVIVTAPGEPLLELGWWIRNDTLALGFNTTLIFGYTNSHMGYFAPPDEYQVGGYESQLTFWGIDTAVEIRKNVKAVAQEVAPNK